MPNLDVVSQLPDPQRMAFDSSLGMRDPVKDQPTLFELIRTDRIKEAEKFYSLVRTHEADNQYWPLIVTLVRAQIRENPKSSWRPAIALHVVTQTNDEHLAANGNDRAGKRARDARLQLNSSRSGHLHRPSPVKDMSRTTRYQITKELDGYVTPTQLVKLRHVLRLAEAAYKAQAAYPPEFYESLTTVLAFINRPQATGDNKETT